VQYGFKIVMPCYRVCNTISGRRKKEKRSVLYAKSFSLAKKTAQYDFLALTEYYKPTIHKDTVQLDLFNLKGHKPRKCILKVFQNSAYNNVGYYCHNAM
jgi:hypothetical protein